MTTEKTEKTATKTTETAIVPDQEKRYMANARGHLVPMELVSLVDLLRDELVLRLASRAEELAESVEAFKREAYEEALAFVDMSVAEYGCTRRSTKGGMTLRSYDGGAQVVVDIDDLIAFDERLDAARQLIETCLARWSDGANEHLVKLVQAAFQPRGDGQLSVSRVLSLLRHDIEDPQWQEGMRALRDALQVVGSRRYIRFYRRPGDEQKLRQIAI